MLSLNSKPSQKTFYIFKNSKKTTLSKIYKFLMGMKKCLHKTKDFRYCNHKYNAQVKIIQQMVERTCFSAQGNRGSLRLMVSVWKSVMRDVTASLSEERALDCELCNPAPAPAPNP